MLQQDRPEQKEALRHLTQSCFNHFFVQFASQSDCDPAVQGCNFFENTIWTTVQTEAKKVFKLRLCYQIQDFVYPSAKGRAVYSPGRAWNSAMLNGWSWAIVKQRVEEPLWQKYCWWWRVCFVLATACIDFNTMRSWAYDIISYWSQAPVSNQI